MTAQPARMLIVVVPGLQGGHETWTPLIERLQREEALSGARWLWWDHGKRWYSVADPAAVAIELSARIDQEWRAYGPFDEVVLVGHSFGGMLVRSAYLVGWSADGPSGHSAAEWARHVSRIVLFAAVNRGLDTRRRRSVRAAVWFTRAIPLLRRIVSAHLLRGSNYVTNLRIEWIRHFATLGDTAPIVVQILGTRDELVTRDDSVDVEQFRCGFYLQVPEATHADLYRLDLASDPDGRYALLADAFVNRQPVRAENIDVRGPERVVFVLHGIRADNRTWVQQTIDAIKARWPEVETIGRRYEYISAFRFAIPMTRRRYLTWFQDAYSDALARNPKATFDFIGHSNGTYLFAESLREIPGMRFERAVLVGSVLPTDYDWDERMRRGQLKALRVDGSRYDWPVAWLCSALRGIGMKDVGTGGFDGFTTGSGAIQEFFWYDGGHSAPLAPGNLPALAEYAITGTIRPPALGSQSRWFAIASRATRRIAPVALLLLVVAFARVAVENPVAALAAVAAAVAMIFLLDVL